MTNTDLISKFSNIYIMLLYSIMTNDINRVKHYLNKEMFEKYNQIIERNKKNNELQQYDELNVNKINILNKKILDNKEVITVEIISKYMDYIIDSNTKEFKRGVNNHRVTNTNILTFEKYLDAKDIPPIFECPYCGNSIKIHFSGLCPFCRKTIDMSNYDYILTNLEIK